MIGSKLQMDFPAVILQCRQYRFVYTADIAKMYRQIMIDPRDVHYQRILWRASPDHPIKEYQLQTVTYGTASAPYQTLRVLKQIAHDEGHNFPLALPVLRQQIYVDDCTFGADTINHSKKVRNHPSNLLSTGGFRLRKWTSNCTELLADINPIDHGLACNKDLKIDENLKVLGIIWNPEEDVFRFRISLIDSPGNTKRAVLSAIARLFDPLGWATPVIIAVKIIMQQLWTTKCEWDAIIPDHYLEKWTQLHFKLVSLEEISIPRWRNFSADSVHAELHSFADASTKAFAAVVYLRVVLKDRSVTISLLVAKSKVAPLKTISLPRLELSAAVLLTRLIQFVRNSIENTLLDVFCWTDSTITLAWIKKAPYHWKTFIANRVAEIQTNIPNANWQHVTS